MSQPLRFRNARGEWVAVESVPAARLKNEPATVIDRVVAGAAVAITRHDKPRAVLVSYEDFRQLADSDPEPAVGDDPGPDADREPEDASQTSDGTPGEEEGTT